MPAIYPVSYTSIGEVYSAFPPISSVTALTSGVLSQAFAGPVQAEINGKIARRYALPFSQEVPLLSAIALRETIYRISISRLMTSFPAAQAGKATIQVMHEQDQELLRQIMVGEIELLDSSLVALPVDLTRQMIYSTTQDYNPTFHEGLWVDQVQDTDKLADIIDDRQGRGL